MKLISSKMTFLYKKVFIIFWVGFITSFLMLNIFLQREIPANNFDIDPTQMLLIMLVFGFVAWKFICSDLVDEVIDEGDSLLIRNGRQEVRIFIQDIETIKHQMMVNPDRVTIRTKTISAMGNKFVFMPKSSFIPFIKHADIKDLFNRVKQKQRN